MSKKNVLDRVYLESPCASEWASMEGNEQVRFCSECNRHVYNLSAIPKTQAEELLAEAGGRLCGRFDRDDRGNIITSDQLRPPSPFRVRLPKFTGAAIAAFLGIGIMGQSHVVSASNRVIAACLAPSRKSAERTLARGEKATLAGTVLDITGAAIVGAAVTLINEKNGQEQKVVTSAEGQYRFEELDPGTYTIKGESPGFVSFRQSGLELRTNEQRRIDVTLQVGTVGGLAILRDSHESKPILRVISFSIRAIQRALGLTS